MEYKVKARAVASFELIERSVYADTIDAAARSVASELAQIGYRLVSITRPIVPPAREV